MGQLVNGRWEKSDVRVGAENSKGEFLRKPMTFRKNLEKGGRFAPELNRYHLYVSYACPWAHRVLITRALKQLTEAISVSFVSPNMLDDGWTFHQDYDNIPEDPLYGAEFLRDIYLKADSNFTGKVTVPVLWDKKEQTIVNNESSELIRILNSAFLGLAGNDNDYCPDHLLNDIDQWNEKIYNSVNNGVYRCGFARSQQAYNEAYEELFERLDELESHLLKSQWLCGETLTEADIRLFPTLLRFDPVYHTHFKCNGRLIAQYQALSRFVQDFLRLPGVASTINLKHVKQHYYYSHDSINPSRIVPLGPKAK